MADPRVFFAAERTLLAWVRSGLTVIALGFVVARFGLFLHVVTGASAPGFPRQPRPWSTALGIAVVVLGAGAIVGALYNHRAFVRSLPPEDVPALAVPWLTTFLAGALAAVGLLLAGYLAMT
jgi:putative membrane protein